MDKIRERVLEALLARGYSQTEAELLIAKTHPETEPDLPPEPTVTDYKTPSYAGIYTPEPEPTVEVKPGDITAYRDFVGPEGSLTAPIVLIGEAPGRSEVAQKRPFVGQAGQLLNGLLNSAGIARRACYITNVFDRPVTKSSTKYYIDNELVYDTAKGFTAAGEPYVTRLHERIDKTTAHVMVPMGAPALEAMTGFKLPMKRRGSIYTYKERKVIPTVHPAAALRNYLFRYYIIYDLKRVLRESATKELPTRERTFITGPTFEQVMSILRTFNVVRQPLTIDLEVVNQEISCFGIGRYNQTLVIPFLKHGGQYWSIEQEMEIWRYLDFLMDWTTITIIGQNLMFDTWVLAKNNILVNGPLEDTMVQTHIMYPDFPKGLDFIASVHTDQPYYKDEGKQWFKFGGDFQQLWNYNATDVDVTDEAFYKMDAEMPEEYRKPYRDRIDLFPVLLYMQMRGIKADREQLESVKAELIVLQDKAQEELNQIVGYEINTNSPKQMKEYFYDTKGIPEYISRKTGNVTTDNTAMKRIAKGTSTRPGLKEAKLVQEIRSYRKLRGTYLDIEFDTDSRLRCAYNPSGTSTGRLSSSQTLYGTGTNMQNLPEQFKRFLVADEGCVLVELDKRQGEWVITAYLSGDPQMIGVVESGEDAHLSTAHLAFGVPKELIAEDAKLLAHETDPIQIARLRRQYMPYLSKYRIPSSMSIRQAGKKSNHALNYNLGYKAFALNNEVSETDAKLICDAYHNAYPGLRHTYHKYVNDRLRDDRTLYNLFGRPRRFVDRWDQSLLNAGYAFPPQSTLVEVINLGLIKTYNDQDTEAMHRVDLLAQVHDSILFQYKVEHIGDLNMLARAIFIMREYLNPELEFKGRTFYIETDMKIGLNWGTYGEENPLGMREIEIGSSQLQLAENMRLTHELQTPLKQIT